jgi:hypothetical protein
LEYCTDEEIETLGQSDCSPEAAGTPAMEFDNRF